MRKSVKRIFIVFHQTVAAKKNTDTYIHIYILTYKYKIYTYIHK